MVVRVVNRSNYNECAVIYNVKSIDFKHSTLSNKMRVLLHQNNGEIVDLPYTNKQISIDEA